MSQGMEKLLKKAKKLPDTPGVYFFLGSKKEILYIGKATSLRDRVRSYFGKDLIVTRGPFLVDMVTLAQDIDWRTTDSVLEALLLEANLIKDHQPKYNTKEKDDKSFNYVVITQEEFPQVLLVRGRTIMNAFPKEKIKYLFGPFPHTWSFKTALKIIRKIFPYRDEKCIPLSGRPCFNRQIGLCPGVCTGEVNQKEYGRTIQHLKLLFEGQKRQLIKQLEKEMKEYAKNQEFEKAQEVKRALFGITHIQDVALIKGDVREEINPLAKRENSTFRIEAYDIAHLSGKNTVGAMTVVEDGITNPSEYRKFRIRGNYGVHDIAGLQEILKRRLNHPEWTRPHLIVVDGNATQKRAAEMVLKTRGVHTIPVVAVTKDERHKAETIVGNADIVKMKEKEIILANSEAHRFAITYHRKKRDRII